MHAQLRIARPVSDLPRSVRQYKLGLSLEQIAAFEDHDGFDGVMLGHPDQHFHFEFTFCRHHPVKPSPTPEDLLVFYLPAPAAWETRCALMEQAGFAEVRSFNPYWEGLGRTFRDDDGYTTVIQRSVWPGKA
jgi:hypothetical protein